MISMEEKIERKEEEEERKEKEEELNKISIYESSINESVVEVSFNKITQLKHNKNYFSIGTQRNDVEFSNNKMMRVKSEWKKRKLTFGLMIEPFTNINSSIPFYSSSPPTCIHCSSSFNLYSIEFQQSSMEKIFWECCICNELNEWNPSFGDFNQWKSDLLNVDSTLRSETIEYLDPSSSSTSFNTSFERVFFFLIDLNLPVSFQSKIKESILSSLEFMDPEDRICLLTFSNIVSIYHLNPTSIHSSLSNIVPPVSATVFPGIRTGTIGEMTQRSFQEFPVLVKESSDQLRRALEAIEKSCERTNAANMRCLGSAIETGLRVMNLLKKGREGTQMVGRFFTFLSAFPNYGPGAIPSLSENRLQAVEEEEESYWSQQSKLFFAGLGNSAREIGVSIDLFCCGLGQMYCSILHQLISSNGGTIVMNRESSAEQMNNNLCILLQRTIGYHATLQIIVPDSLDISHVIGPVKSMSTEEVTKFEITSIHQRTALSIYLEPNEDILKDYVYIQFKVNFTNTYNQRVVRVITKRIEMTGNSKLFLESVDTKVFPVLLGKRIVLQAGESRDFQSLASKVDEELKNMVKYNKEIPEIKEMMLVLRRLFSLRRGPLLGPLFQHIDDILNTRIMFVEGHLEESFRLLEPTLIMVNAIEDEDSPVDLIIVPSEDLAMQSNKILILDQQTDLFVWTGGLVSRLYSNLTLERMNEKCQGEILKRTKMRFPQPSILHFKEGSSMARWLQCRLVPSHKDSPEYQISSFPQLEELTEESKKKLISKFHKTDDMSFWQWYNTLFR